MISAMDYYPSKSPNDLELAIERLVAAMASLPLNEAEKTLFDSIILKVRQSQDHKRVNAARPLPNRTGRGKRPTPKGAMPGLKVAKLRSVQSGRPPAKGGDDIE